MLKARVAGLLLVVLVAGCDSDPPPAEDAGPEVDGGPTLCSTDVACSDGVFCNGTERCAPDDEAADARGCIDAPAPSCGAGQRCEEALARCVTACAETADADGDGFSAVVCGGDDCDDSDPDRFPGNPEVCDAEGHDEDCDLTTLAGAGGDADADGFVSAACCNAQADGTLLCGPDCDDTEPNVHPSATEVCNGVDDDCNGLLDHPQEDNDGDGHADPACAGDAGDDCNDNDATIYPGAPELCDRKDNDCDGAPAAGEDEDRDGFADRNSTCIGGPGTLAQTDCDDALDAVFPGASEVCNGLDDNCDGAVDEDPVATLSCGMGIQGVVACTTGTCTMSSCTGSFEDCDDDATNGCEADLDTDLQHCGGCGAVCPTGARCEAGVCRAVLNNVWASITTGEAELTDMALDAAGNVFVAGLLYGGDSIDFGAGPLGVAADSMFLGSYAPDGTPRWGRVFADGDEDISPTPRVAVDDAGNVYVTGRSSDALDVGGGQIVNGTREFLASYGNSGAFRWVRSLVGGSIRDIDAADVVFAVGDFSTGSADVFGQTPPLSGTSDVFLARLTTAGVVEFVQPVGGEGRERAAAVAYDAGSSSVAIGGTLLGPSAIRSATLTPAGETDILFLQLTSGGGLRRAQIFGSAGPDIVGEITVDPVTRIRYLSAVFRGPAILPDRIVVAEGEGHDAALLRFNVNGLFTDSTLLGGSGAESIEGVSSRDGRVLLAGTFDQTFDLGGGPNMSRGMQDAFVGEWNADVSIATWSRAFGGAGSDRAVRVAFTASGEVVLGGNFRGTIDFEGTELSSTGDGDFFLARLTP